MAAHSRQLVIELDGNLSPEDLFKVCCIFCLSIIRMYLINRLLCTFICIYVHIMYLHTYICKFVCMYDCSSFIKNVQGQQNHSLAMCAWS